VKLPKDVRIVDRGSVVFVFNYGHQEQRFTAPQEANFVIGSEVLAPFDVAVYKR
jgi:beta-galactosidase GanA